MKKLNLLKNSNVVFKGICFMALLLIGTNRVEAQLTKPFHYWTFEGANPLKDSMNNSSLNTTTYKSGYSIDLPTAGAVGNSLKLDTSSKTIIATPDFILTQSVSIEFLFKPAADFNTTSFVNRSDGAFSIKFGYPYIQFITASSAGSSSFKVDLDGLGRATYGYYTDGNWHHMVFKYNVATGIKQIWVDGQLPDGFTDTVAPGTFNTGTNAVFINSSTSYSKYFGCMDELALYKQDLPANNIYKHYLDFTQQNHYSFANSSVPPPAASPVTGPVDINDYAPGHPNYNVSAVTQLQNSPLPRFKKGHTLMRNFDWMSLKCFSGENQPGVSAAQVVANSVAIQTELVKNWNYYLMVSCNTSSWGDYNDPTKMSGAWVKLANQNPDWPTSAIGFWAQLNPKQAGYTSTTGYVENKTMPNNYYIRNASGQYLNPGGSVVSTKYISPAAPLDSIIQDGLTQKFNLTKLLSALTRPLNFLNENGEVIPHWNSSALTADAAVLSDKQSSGLDWDDYSASRRKKFSTAYRDQFMSMPALANTHYSEYAVGGNPIYFNYSQTRSIIKPINGQIYSTPDFYPRYPFNWKYWLAAWNGWQSIAIGRHFELEQGDKLFSPCVAAGWNTNEEINIRPAQWLGLLKVLGMSGAEFYYSGYFNEAGNYTAPNPPPSNPAGYAYQALMPVYAQAITSRYENVLRNGDLMEGDVPDKYNNPQNPGYSFYAGDQRKLVVARKDQTLPIYAITGTIQPNSNMIGNTEMESDATIKFNGSTLQFDVRRQGSTYIYDNTNPAAPVFYQLDGWHESSHPYRWSKDFRLESELFDNSSTAFRIKTDRASGAVITDFRGSTSFISIPTGSTTASAEYYIQPRTASNYYFWVRARSKNGTSSSITVKMDSLSKNIGCITDTAWQWYSVDACSQLSIAYPSLSAGEHKLIITATGAGIEIDKMLLTIDGSLNLNPNQAACSSATASVTASGSTSFCQGGNVTLTASSSNAYQWSNGATTQSITVSTTGNYTVSIASGACNAVSTPIAVTVKSKPSATVTANGSTTICANDSVQLIASSATSYAWSNGSTSQSFYTSSAGNYLVTVTGANGCTATSSAKAVTLAPSPTATITASGSLQLAVGQTVVLAASSGTSYVWYPGGETSNSITVNQAGNYSVTVFNANGCSATSSVTAVTALAGINVTITSSGATTICDGDSVILSAPASMSSYVWMPNGETSRSITAKQADTYSVTVTNALGNTGSANATVSVNPVPNAPVIAISYIPNVAYQLTASEPSAASYLWSNGETTATITLTTPAVYLVQAINSFGCVSEWDSMDVNSITGQACSKADMLTAFNIADTSVTLQWNPAVTGDSFLITYWKNGTSIMQTKTVNGNVSSAVINGLQSGTDYTWTVQTNCLNNIHLSDPAYFSTINNSLPCGSIPQNLSASDINTKIVNLNWYPTIATTFKVQYRQVGVTAYSTKIYDGIANIDGAVLNNLSPSTTYEWKILSVCNGVSSVYSPLSFFTTLDTCGYLGILEVNNIAPSSAKLMWDNTDAMDTVRIRLTNETTGLQRNIYLSQNPTNAVHEVTGLKPNTAYSAQVRGKCATGQLGGWSNKITFLTSDIVVRLEAGNPLGLNGYPNPAVATLNYTFTDDESSEYTLKVADMSGRELIQQVRYAEQGSNAGELNVQEYSTGLYMLIVQKGAQSSRFRFAVH